MIRVVLDANVFVSALIRPEGPPGQLVRLLLTADAFGLVVTPAIAAEIARALRYPSVKKLLKGGFDVDDWLADLAIVADIVEDGALPTAVSSDPDDDKYLYAAAAGRAAFVVTGDRHLLDVGDYEGIRIVTPRRFLDVLRR